MGSPTPLNATALPGESQQLDSHTRECLTAADRLQRAVLAHERLASAATTAAIDAGELAEGEAESLERSWRSCVAYAEAYRIVRTRPDWRGVITEALSQIVADAQEPLVLPGWRV